MTEERKDKIKMWICIGIIAVAPGIIGGLIVRERMLGGISYKEKKLDQTIENAKKLIDDISGKVNTAVQSVYSTEAKNAFEERLKSITDEEITNMCKKVVKANVNDVLTKQASKAISCTDIRSAIKDYIDDNSTYFDRKIIKSITGLFDDDDFVDTISEAITDAIYSNRFTKEDA